MEQFLTYLITGFCGGIVRGLVRFVKNKTLEKANYFKLTYFLITVLISGSVGFSAWYWLTPNGKFLFLAGYAGTVFIENLYKLKMKFFTQNNL